MDEVTTVVIIEKDTRALVAAIPAVLYDDMIVENGYEEVLYYNGTDPLLYEDENGKLYLKDNSCIVKL
jgi:hypothetical protein